MDDGLHHVDGKSVLPPRTPPALGIVLVGSEVVASHPRARLEPSANEMRSSANADDFTRFPNPVEAKVANLKFSGGTSRGRGR